jgi:hypothetical protein
MILTAKGDGRAVSGDRFLKRSYGVRWLAGPLRGVRDEVPAARWGSEQPEFTVAWSNDTRIGFVSLFFRSGPCWPFLVLDLTDGVVESERCA